MKIRPLRSATVGALLALLLLPLAACTAVSDTITDDPSAASGGTSAPAAQSTGDSPPTTGELYGCTEAVVEYARGNGYPRAVPLDPATLEIPLTAFATPPDCYLVDDYAEAVRYSAFWQNDPQGTLAALGSALSEAGYVQSDDYGPLVWWVGGEDPTIAEHAISAAPQPVDGVDMLWATW